MLSSQRCFLSDKILIFKSFLCTRRKTYFFKINFKINNWFFSKARLRFNHMRASKIAFDAEKNEQTRRSTVNFMQLTSAGQKTFGSWDLTRTSVLPVMWIKHVSFLSLFAHFAQENKLWDPSRYFPFAFVVPKDFKFSRINFKALQEFQKIWERNFSCKCLTAFSSPISIVEQNFNLFEARNSFVKNSSIFSVNLWDGSDEMWCHQGRWG